MLFVFLVGASHLHAGQGQGRARLVDAAITLQPGSTLEVEIEFRSEAFGRPSLRVPRSDSLQRLAVQALPFEVEGDFGYVYRWRVVYQVVRSGEIELAGGRVGFQDSVNEETPIELAPLRLTVAGFGSEVDHDGLEPLPDGRLKEGGNRLWVWGSIFAALLALIVVGAFVFRVRRRVETSGSVGEVDTFRAALGAVRKSGIDSAEGRKLLERFFLDFRSRCSVRLAGEIEAYLYSRRGNADRLSGLIEEEHGR